MEQVNHYGQRVVREKEIMTKEFLQISVRRRRRRISFDDETSVIVFQIPVKQHLDNLEQFEKKNLESICASWVRFFIFLNWRQK